jgi:hypothetical protein
LSFGLPTDRPADQIRQASTSVLVLAYLGIRARAKQIYGNINPYTLYMNESSVAALRDNRIVLLSDEEVTIAVKSGDKDKPHCGDAAPRLSGYH